MYGENLKMSNIDQKSGWPTPRRLAEIGAKKPHVERMLADAFATADDLLHQAETGHLNRQYVGLANMATRKVELEGN